MSLPFYRVLSLIACMGVLHTSAQGYKTTIQGTDIAPHQKKIEVIISLDKDEVIYKDGILVTVNSPDIQLSTPTMRPDSITQVDPVSKKNKHVYKDSLTITTIATAKEGTSPDGQVQTNFIVSSSTQPVKATTGISFAKATDKETDTQAIRVSELAHQTTPKSESFIKKITHSVSSRVQKWYDGLKNLFEGSGSSWIKYLLALLIGLLLSLTPCIYPMIPVTIGILQANKGSSPTRNFILALAYTCGISLTFAALGFIAALGSSVFGQMQTSVWILLPVIAVLFYLGFAMFGLYEMYIPRFMQPSSTTKKDGSMASAFIFGMLSGTVASPCLSPGLALIISYVTKITQTGGIMQYAQGFAMLFAFGIGTSLPLLLIGTFSSSLSLLPRAGMWMVEVKRILGLMLIGMAFYYLQNIIPWPVLIWIIAACILFIAMYYITDRKEYDTKWARGYKSFMGEIGIIAALLMAALGVKTLLVGPKAPTISAIAWHTDYEAARKKAIAENKNLFLDFSTTWCAACKKLEKDVLGKDTVQKALEKYVMVKVDATNPQSEPYAHLQKPLDIKGFPTLVILNPKDETEIKKWVGYITDVNQFITDLA